MLKKPKNKLSFRSFSTVEYAFLIAVSVAALIGMSVYLKRAIMGKWQEVGDTFGHGRQYDPVYTIIDRNP